MIMRKHVFQDHLHKSFIQFKEKTAIEYADRKVTYHDLEKKSGQIAGWILQQGIEKGTFIGILMEDKIQLICTMMGILRAGCVFVPLDITNPHKRIERMVTAIGLKHICTDKSNINRFISDKSNGAMGNQEIALHLIHDLPGPPGNSWTANLPDDEYTPEDKIYVCFTSGTTGKPKGIVGKNKSLLHYVQWEVNTFNIDKNFRIAQSASPGFDAFLKEVFVAFLSGATLCIPQDMKAILNSEALIGWMEENRITLLHCVPTLFRLLNSEKLTVNHFPHLKYILLAGAPIFPSELKKWYNIMDERIRIINLYGLTETTILNTYYPITKPDVNRNTIPIGKPIKGTRIVILDENMNICNQKVIGEIYIRTPYRTFGYYNDPRLNAQRFIPNPFNTDPNDLIYKTGDLGKLLEDGNFEFVGRKDRQIKLRGIRIEMEEIETVLMSHPAIKEAVVMKENPGQNSETYEDNEFLYSFIVVGEQESDLPDQSQFISQIKAHTAERLPNYMVPAKIIRIEEIPRLPNGKVDYETLSDVFTEENIDYVPPRDHMEKKLLEFWSQVLRREKIGITNNFFEMGGNSLNIMSLIFEIHREFDVRLSIEELFYNLTIEAQAKIIKEAKKEIYILIKPREKMDYYPVSSAQKRIFFMRQLESESMSYNSPFVFTFQGNLDKDRLEEALSQLIRRQESLRTSFLEIDGDPVQRIHDQVEFTIENYESNEPGVANIIRGFVRPFDLSQAPLFRLGLIHIGENKNLLIIDTYHIITDGVSGLIFLKDLLALFNNEHLPPMSIHYKDFAAWQNEELKKPDMNKQEEYWLKVLEGEIPKLNLAYDFQRPTVKGFQGDFIQFKIRKDHTKRLKKLASQEDSTLFILMLTIFNVLLSRVNDQEDILLGTPIAGRMHEQLQQVIGMFANNLVLRNFPQKKKTFSEFHRDVRIRTLEAFENQSYQFENLVEKIEIDRDASRNPIFDVSFQLGKVEKGDMEKSGLKSVSFDFLLKKSKFDLSVGGGDLGEELFFIFNFDVKLFKKKTIETLSEQFQNIIFSVLNDPGQTLEDIQLMSKEKKEALIRHFNTPLRSEFKGIESYNYIFQEKLLVSFMQFKNKVAIEYGDQMITYQELAQRSNYAAHWMIEKGIGKETFIGILMNDRVDIILTVLGALKAGCVIVPLYSAYPVARLENMINTTRLNYVFIDSINFNRLKLKGVIDANSPQREFILMESMYLCDKDRWFGQWPQVRYSPEDQIYIHFTSGTTGIPKAVIGKNESLLHFIEWEIETFNITSDFRVAQFTIPGFDPFLRDVFAPLCSGGIVCIPVSEEILMDGEELVNWADHHRINLIHCVASLFKLLSSGSLTQNHLKHLKCILLAGEKISPGDLIHWYETFDERIGLFNLYGPTETTMSKLYYHIRPSDLNRLRIPIGKPIKGARAIILDENMNPCDELVKGEIYIRTPYRTCRYDNDPLLNEKKFIQNPFNDEKGDILYKTGDLARLLPDGNIDILGRIDRQVKIRGYRIELEEIESLLLWHPLVKEAVVLKTGINDNELLSAYITVKQGSATAAESMESQLKKYLSEQLPDYMIPASITEIDKIPRKATGKVDYILLTAKSLEVKPAYIPPQNETEKKLIDIWAEIFRSKKIGRTDHFFKLGGNSLNVMQLISKIHREFNIRIPLGEVFNNLTVEKLARVLRKAKEEKYFSIAPTEKKEYYPLSSQQKRLYILRQMAKDSINYNIPTVVLLEGNIDKIIFEGSFKRLIKRYEVLRTSFIMVDQGPVQKVHAYDEVVFKVKFYHKKEQEINPLVMKFIRPFHLDQCPLLRVGVAQIGKNQYLLMLDIHHIISDGVSMQLLVEEFMILYGGRELGLLKLHYRDYSEWQNRQNRNENEALAKQEKYWLQQFEDGIPTLNLPTDFPRPAVMDSQSRMVDFVIQNNETAALKKIAQQEGITIYILMLTIFNVLLAKLSDQDDIVIGTDIAGRSHADLERTMGMFVNMLALRNFPRLDKTFRQLLGEIKQRTLEAFENQDYQFDQLVEKLKIHRQVNRHPLFDVMFSFFNVDGKTTGISNLDLPNLKLRSYKWEFRPTKFDMIFTGMEMEDTIKFEIDYDTAIFEEKRMRKYIRFFNEITATVINNLDIQLKDIVITHDLMEAKSGPTQFDFSFQVG